LERPDPPSFLLLDLYDTLVSFDRRLIAARRATTAARLGVTPEALERADRATMPDRMLGRRGGLHDELAGLLRAAGAPAGTRDVAAFVAAELGMWEAAVVVHDDVRPALARLRRHGVRLGLVSNCCHLTPPLLGAWGLRDRFDAVTLSCEAGCVKPSPRLFERALAAIGGEAARGLLVDDRQECVEAARALGLRARRIVRGAPPGAPGVVADLGELADLLLGGGEGSP
jgi:putative hydrolase of the HAD superfamily